MNGSLEFYATPGPMTSAGSHAALLERLPCEIDALRKVVQGLMIHIFWAERYGVQLPGSRWSDVQLRRASHKLGRVLELDRRPLEEARAPGQRAVGNCRDFSLMLTAFLRYQHVPARARCGFARYFIPNHYEDHWVCEYWHAGQGRWVLVDAQLDELQCAALSIPFDPLDVPRDEFIVGGKAWQLCRSRQADPETFGIADLHGLWFVRGDMVRDVASLNKMELLPWDSWGLIEGRDDELSRADLALLDRAADLANGDVPEFDTLRALYEDEDGLRVPTVIRSYTQAGPQTVDLTQA